MSIHRLMHVCQACEKMFNPDEYDLKPGDIKDYFDRVAPGDPTPSGQCPDCGALTHIEERELPPEKINTGDTLYILNRVAFEYDDQFYSTGNYGNTFSEPDKIYLTREAAEKAMVLAKRDFLSKDWEHGLPIGEDGLYPKDRKCLEELGTKLKELFGIDVDFTDPYLGKNPMFGAPPAACDLFWEYVNLPSFEIHEVKVA